MFKRILVNKKTKFALYPRARAAYEWIKNYQCLIKSSNLSTEIKHELAQADLYAIEHKEGKSNRAVLQIYSPLPSLLFWQDDTPPIGTQVFIDTSITEEDIEKRAWISVLNPLIWSIDPSTLFNLRDDLAKLIPLHLLEYFFSTKRFTDTSVCKLTGVSRGALVQQRQKYNKNVLPNSSSKKEVIDLLSQPWDENVDK